MVIAIIERNISDITLLPITKVLCSFTRKTNPPSENYPITHYTIQSISSNKENTTKANVYTQHYTSNIDIRTTMLKLLDMHTSTKDDIESFIYLSLITNHYSFITFHYVTQIYMTVPIRLHTSKLH